MAAVSLARKRLPLRGLMMTLILLPLVVPYIVWLSALGFTVAIRWASAPREAAR